MSGGQVQVIASTGVENGQAVGHGYQDFRSTAARGQGLKDICRVLETEGQQQQAEFIERQGEGLSAVDFCAAEYYYIRHFFSF